MKGKNSRWGTNYRKLGFLMWLYPLTNFKIQKYHQNPPNFNDVYSRHNFPKIKNGGWAINLDNCKSIATHWIAIFAKNDVVTYFYKQEKYQKTTFYRMQANDSTMSGYLVLDLLIYAKRVKFVRLYQFIFY